MSLKRPFVIWERYQAQQSFQLLALHFVALVLLAYIFGLCHRLLFHLLRPITSYYPKYQELEEEKKAYAIIVLVVNLVFIKKFIYLIHIRMFRVFVLAKVVSLFVISVIVVDVPFKVADFLILIWIELHNNSLPISFSSCKSWSLNIFTNLDRNIFNNYL